MKKTQIIELFMNIRRNRVTFVSILLFVCMATAIFLGIGWSTDAFEKTVDRTLVLGNMQDAEVFFPYGIPEKILSDIRAADGVEAAVGNYSASVSFERENIRYLADVRTLSDNVNTPFRTEGRLPEKPGEIAVDLLWAKSHGVKIGDMFTVTESGTPHLTQPELTVTALIHSPQYIGQFKQTNGLSAETGIPFDCIFFADKSSFALGTFLGYSSVSVIGRGMREYSSYSDEYDAADERLCDRITAAAANSVEMINAMLPASYPKAELSVQGRMINASIGSTIPPKQIMENVKYTLAYLFVLVGVFVCYSAISRTVYEQTELIGTKKALGLARRSITASYLVYVGLAVLLGSVAGAIAARFIVEPIILAILTDYFCIAGPVSAFALGDVAVFFAAELMLNLLFAVGACRSVLRRKAVDLLKGNAEVRGKRRFFEEWNIWERLPLLTKTIVNNFFNDRRRVFATLVGVAGSCAILVSAMVLTVNVCRTCDYHRREISPFDTVAYVNSGVADSAVRAAALLEANGIDASPVLRSSAYFKTENSYMSGMLLAYDDTRFQDQFRLLRDGKPLPVEDGVFICNAYADYYSLQPGDTVEVMDRTGATVLLPVERSFDYSLTTAAAVMNAETYERYFNGEFVPNAVLFRRGNMGLGALTGILAGEEGFISIEDAEEQDDGIFDYLTNSIFIITAIFSVSAVVMSFTVLLNLMVMFVEEKKRELIVMMINGYSRKQTKRYIYSDTVLLTVIGSVIGVFVGVAVAFITLRTFSTEVMLLQRKPYPLICLACMAVTGILSLINTRIALKRVDRFHMRDITA